MQLLNSKQLLESALEAAHLAGELLRLGFNSAKSISSKEGRHNLVTEFDLASETRIMEVLRHRTPGSTMLTEESGLHAGSGDLVWVIDPLDGTVNFAHGIPIFCVSIAAVVSGEIIAGVIHQPLTNETFTSVRGQGSLANNRRMQVSETDSLSDSILVTGFPYNVENNPLQCIDQFARIVGTGLPIRRLGSAALDLAYVADGRFDGYWEVALHPWDMAAGVLMVTEAGGMVSHYSGRGFVLGEDSIVATNGRIHQQLVAALEPVA
ncbi:MAG: inositol monophosphatase [Candidatus Kapabacteria bacterium]|nr:inositol monophosphatase [Candidatus Kapabacteria bacterium]